MTTVTTVDLPAEVWQAAVIADQHRTDPAAVDTTTPAGQLAAAALAAADRGVMDDLADDQQAHYTPSGKTGPRVSDAGACPRSVWYREHPPADYTPDPVDTRRAVLGQIIHRAAQHARSARYPWRLYEFDLPVPGLDRPGRPDEYDPVIGEVTDNKTAGARKWEITSQGPTPDMWAQVMIYGLCLDRIGWPIRTVRIIVINRDTGDEEHHRRAYDPAEAQAALDDLIDLATQLDLGIVPDRAGTGPYTYPCTWCEARTHCWGLWQAALSGGASPEALTTLGTDPTRALVAWAAWRLAAASKAATEADKGRKAASAVLVGVPAAVYDDPIRGPIEVRQERRDMPDYALTYARIAEMLETLLQLPPSMWPPLEDIVRVQYRTDRYPRVYPVRTGKSPKKEAT